MIDDKESLIRGFWGYKVSLVCDSLQKPRGGGGGETPLCDLNGDVRPDRVWFSECFVLNRVSISSVSVLDRVSLHNLIALNRISFDVFFIGLLKNEAHFN